MGRHSFRRRRYRRHSRDGGAALFILVVAVGFVWHWMSNLPSAEVHSIETASSIVLAVVLAIILWLWRGRWVRRRAYRRALRDFHWNPHMSPEEFETCCADYLKLHGWRARLTPKTGDQGADVIARRDGRIVVIQCKLYSKAVGNGAVQEVSAARGFYHARSAVVVSNQSYTASAKALARENGVYLLHFTALRRLDEILGDTRG